MKKAIVLFVLAGMFAMQSGCARLPNDEPNFVASGDRTIPTDFANQPKIERTLTSFLRVSATPTVPEQWKSGYANTVWAKSKDVNEEMLNKILALFKGPAIAHVQRNEQDVCGAKRLSLLFSLEDGGQLANSSSLGVLYHTISGVHYIQMMDSSFNLADMESHKPENETEEKQIAEKIRQDLREIGVEFSDYHVSYWELADIKSKNERYNRNNENQIVKDWEKDDEFYWYQMIQTIDGIPLVPNDHGPEDAYAFGGNMEVKYSHKGWEQFVGRSLYDKMEVEKENQKLITAQEAATCIEKAYAPIISSGNVVLGEVHLEYLPTVVDKEPLHFLMVPAWRFVETERHFEEDEAAEQVGIGEIYVNAITGEIIE